MSIVSAVLKGSPRADLLKSLAGILGTGVMEVRQAWLSGAPVLTVEVLGGDYERDVESFRRLQAWSVGVGLPLDLFETDGSLPGKASRPAPEDEEYITNALTMGQDLRASPLPEDRP